MRTAFQAPSRSQTLLIVALFTWPQLATGDWPQASGPNGNFAAEGSAPTQFSASLDQNILWRVPLPSTGQGTAIVSNSRVFVTSHEPISADTETGSTIFGLCFDADTGKELWRRPIPGTRVTDLSSLFSDNTAASPVADGRSVCFTNVGGTFTCFDFTGKELWSHTWTPFGRHHARMHEPILHNGTVIQVHAPCYDLPQSATTKSGARPLGRGPDVWTYLQAYDMATGQRRWQAQSATSIHSTSIIGQFNNTNAILTGRGGGHQPPEEPYGLSLINADDGSRIWDAAIQGYAAAQNASWNSDIAGFFVRKEHQTIDTRTGKPISRTSLTTNATVRRYIDGNYVTQTNQTLTKGRKALTNQSNCLIGDYHYFRTHHGFLIGRINIRSNKVEYLQVPAQVVRSPDEADQTRWDKALPNDMKTANGFTATQDKRNAGNGWGHVSAASPIVIGDYIYMPTMIGMIYVLKWNAKELNEQALISISDLGPASQTWTLSSLSYANGRIYARTLKELICIGKQ